MASARRLGRLGLLLAALWLLLPQAFAEATGAQPAAAAPLASIPQGRGLPVSVRASVMFLGIEAVDENAGRFSGLVDIRLLWQDDRLAYDAREAPRGFRSWRGEAAVQRMAKLWVPDISIGNLVGEPAQLEHGLRLFPDGRVEWMRRVGGEFASAFDGHRFPFDRQQLRVELISRDEPLERVALDFGQLELDESQRGKPVADGWQVGLVELARAPAPGWYRQQHAGLVASLDLQREPGTALAVLYVPLFASLLIPLLALWLNRCEDGEFKVEAFELTNIVIGGLFAVVALNFTFNSEYPWLASGGNSASQLFGLNYLTLAACFAINIALFRFDLARRLAGRAFQQEVYAYLAWALPALVLIAATAMLAQAMA